MAGDTVLGNDFKEEAALNREMVVVLDFGGQYNQLIARRVRSEEHTSELQSQR